MAGVCTPGVGGKDLWHAHSSAGSVVMSRLGTDWPSTGLILISTISIYLSVILYTRIAGLRSLATMSSFDFAATVAIGSTVATVANLGTPTVNGLVVLALLYLLQAGMALARRSGAERFLDNNPLLLMAGPVVIHDHLRQVRVTEQELISQLRAHGVTHMSEVRAAIMESTGSISVLTGATLDRDLLTGVRGLELLDSNVK